MNVEKIMNSDNSRGDGECFAISVYWLHYIKEFHKLPTRQNSSTTRGTFQEEYEKVLNEGGVLNDILKFCNLKEKYTYTNQNASQLLGNAEKGYYLFGINISIQSHGHQMAMYITENEVYFYDPNEGVYRYSDDRMPIYLEVFQ